MSDIDRIINRAERLIERHKDQPQTLSRNAVLDDLLGSRRAPRRIKGGDPVAAALDNPEQASYQDLCKGIDDAISRMDIEQASALYTALGDQIDKYAKAANDINRNGKPNVKTRVKGGIQETFDPMLRTWLRDSPKGRR
jgi:hypothetical protein